MEEIETKKCTTCGTSFRDTPEEAEFYARMKADQRECRSCRMQHLFAFWPFGKFNKRTCSKSGEPIISLYPKDARFPVYANKYWYADDWEIPSAEYDPSRPFFDQFYELQSKIPRPMQFGTQNENSDYCDDVWESKNCYLCRSLFQCDGISYSYRTVRCRDSYDLFYCYDTEQSYDCSYCFKVFNVKHSFDVRDSFDSAFLYDCRDVRNCFMCWNLRHREYCILNEQYSKEEYEKKIAEFNTGSRAAFNELSRSFAEKIKNEAVHKTDFNVKTVDSSGNYLVGCKGCENCFFFEESEDCVNIIRGLNSRNTGDSTGVLQAELVWNVCQLTEGYNLKNSCNSARCRESEYLDFCDGCDYCFGCIGLRNKKYHILNKQYSEDEYERKKEEIINAMKGREEYGGFFPYKFACLGYNLSTAAFLFPKTKKEIEDLGSFWEELETSIKTERERYIEKDDITEVEDSVLASALVCRETGRVFNVTRSEFDFLRHHKIPLPDRYPDVRTMQRVRELFSVEPYADQCHFCGKTITTYYSRELGYKKIACTECYQKEVV